MNHQGLSAPPQARDKLQREHEGHKRTRDRKHWGPLVGFDRAKHRLDGEHCGFRSDDLEVRQMKVNVRRFGEHEGKRVDLYRIENVERDGGVGFELRGRCYRTARAGSDWESQGCRARV